MVVIQATGTQQIITKYRKLRIRVWFARFSQIQLQELFTGKESIVLSCRQLSFSASQRVKMENSVTYRKLFLIKSKDFLNALENKTM